jgi:predicted RNA-binding Zn-ribbon protein involved in translation (DUF1610 family)
MDPLEFERWIAQWFQERGYDTKLTSKTNDKGIDVIAEDESETLAIQAKAYSPTNKVSSPEVQQVSGLLARSDIDGVVLCTTSTLTNEARSVAKNRGIHVISVELKTAISDINYIGPRRQAPTSGAESDNRQTPYDCPNCGEIIREHRWSRYYTHFEECHLPNHKPDTLTEDEWEKVVERVSREVNIEYTCPYCDHEFKEKEDPYKPWIRYLNHFEDCNLPKEKPDPLSDAEWQKLQAQFGSL